MTISAIQPARSAETWVIAAYRCGPSWSNKPRDGLVERERVPGAIPRSRYVCNDHAVLTATDSWRVGLDAGSDGADVGAASGNRTPDNLITSEVLCRLS